MTIATMGGPGRSPFDNLRRLDEAGEWWSARDLMPLYGYSAWQGFSRVIDRAKLACATSAQDVSSNFIRIDKINNSRHRVEDYRLTRYAAYLVAMEGDPSKPEIGGAKTYFAVQTHRSEQVDALDDDLGAIHLTLMHVQKLRTEQRRLHVQQMQQGQTLTEHARLLEASGARIRAAQDDIDAARLEVAENRIAVDRAKREVIELAGRIDNVEHVTPLKDATGLHGVKEAGQLLGYGLITFYEQLRRLGVVYRDPQQQGHKVYQKHRDAGWGEARWEEWANGGGHAWVPYFTAKGVVEIKKLFERDGLF